MKIAKKKSKYLLVALFVFILSFPLWIKHIPTRYVPFLICNFSTKVGGESMNSLIAPGSLLELNRCFEESDLTKGTVVLFNDNSNLQLGIIRHVLPLDPIVYKISDEKAPRLLHDVIKEEITAITNKVDTSASKYLAEQETESFILDSSVFLTDFYLAKIPRGSGIETSTVKKANSFSRQEDKFCSVIVPKKNLTAVDTEITNTETQKTVSQGSDIILNASTNPNINCMDFGVGPGMLNLAPGTYRYRFLMSHQVLADVQFEVRN